MDIPASSQPETPAPPATTEVDALIDALAQIRGRRGHRGGLGAGGTGRSGGGRGPRGDHPRAAHGAGEADGRAQHGPHARGGGPALVRLLSTILHEGEPLSVSELAVRIGVDQPRASRLVQQAVEHGHAEREADPSDARRSRVRVTESGAQLVHTVRSRQRDDAGAALAALDAAERTQLLALLGKLAAAWPQHQEPRS